ncbi:threonine/serine ThrE exporter family protein [Clostridium cochlearium]|uniref:Structural protein/integral membrane protein n=1 Tax=Clostridium cochlearium TaxID=1494 RepID=A0A240AUT3_CLOCO|nr:threonine/serine exporter family protein [Clostridium cochlearium]MBV1820477.1 threonine/serine exporter family protein [Bacteroidales bacterium MSK.15.36]NSJ92028.1 threonine/serine exporter family protein [Coprococcus sp. MSK.21.13]MCG4571806.1 threonine/serine exporter family protein [Clostridium cochlearium]MCG4580952.1 threonine/serine exporter family protein [Clostridium cochlearium]NOH17296.1 threonine/serine exporter family protein [Clostridium cochlearium]
MNIDKILHLVTYAGQIMLENGAETYRVEETMKLICNSYEIFNTDIFVIPTSIIISVSFDNGQTLTKVKRIQSRTVDLDKVSKVNDLSRKICTDHIPLNIVEESLNTINSNNKYNDFMQIFAFSIVAGFFTLFFGGNFKDFFVSLFIGALLQIISLRLSQIEANTFFVNILCGSLTTFIAHFSTTIGFGNSMNKIIIGSLMPLVPGLSITNAIRDIIAGELVSGLSKLTEAFLIAAAIAIGAGITLSFGINFL